MSRKRFMVVAGPRIARFARVVSVAWILIVGLPDGAEAAARPGSSGAVQDAGGGAVPSEPDSTGFVGRAEARSDRERSIDAAGSKARLQAIRRMIESRLVPDARWEALSPAVRAVGNALVVGYLQDSIDLSDAAMFEAETDGRRVTVTLRVPQGVLDGHRMSVDEFIVTGLSRSRSGEASFLEQALILELLEPDDARRIDHRSAMVDSLGPFFQSSIQGGWTPASVQRITWAPSEVPPLGDWATSSLELITEGRRLPATPGMSYEDSDGSSLPAGISIERMIGLASLCENHPRLVREVGTRLDAAGWSSTATIFRTGSAGPPASRPLPPAAKRSETPRKLVTLVLSTHQLLRQYVSEGMAPVRAAGTPGPEYADALKSFGAGGETDVIRAGALLSSAAGRRELAIDEWSLLAATMFSFDEHALARAFARTAWRLDPTHPYAGVNAVRAALALGLFEEAAEIIPAVTQKARLDGWGRGQLDEARIRIGERSEPTGGSSSNASAPLTPPAEESASDPGISEADDL